MSVDQVYDCLIIGGGPAGLTAAEYMGRYLRSVALVDSGSSRAAWIPTSHIYPGFAKGISGKDFLDKLREQVSLYDVETYQAEATSLRKDKDLFYATCGNIHLIARKVILATGMSLYLYDLRFALGVAEGVVFKTYCIYV